MLIIDKKMHQVLWNIAKTVRKKWRKKENITKRIEMYNKRKTHCQMKKTDV